MTNPTTIECQEIVNILEILVSSQGRFATTLELRKDPELLVNILETLSGSEEQAQTLREIVRKAGDPAKYRPRRRAIDLNEIVERAGGLH